MAFVYAPSGADNTANYDVESSSLIRYHANIVDNIFNKRPLLDFFKRNDAVVMYDGGASIGVPVEYATNSTVQAMDYYTQLDTTPQKISQTAEYQWGMYGGTASISHKEKRQNAGNNIYNLYEAKARNLSESVANQINTDMFAAAATSNGMNTLVTLVDATSTIGNINSTTQSFWQSTSTGSGSFAAQGLSDMETLYNTLSSASEIDSPNFVITTSSVFGFYNLELHPQVRYTDTSMANAGFTSLKFHNATVTWDRACTSGVMYMLNTDAIKLYIDSGTNFIMSEGIKTSTQIAEVYQMAAMLQLCVLNRRRLGKLTGITA